MPQLLTERLTPRDRLGAALEGMVIGDRWGADLASLGEPWQPRFLQIVDGVLGGDLSPALWRSHCQGVTQPAAVLITLVPQLWRQADAHAHHRGAVGHWVAELGLAAPLTVAADGLFMVLCQQHRTSAPALGPGAGEIWDAALAEVGLAGVAQILAQSQHQLSLGLSLGQRRGQRGPELALIGLLAGLRGGRSSLGGGLRQRWLPQGRAADPWPGVNADALESLATALHRRWAGLGPRQLVPAQAEGRRVLQG